MSTIFVQCEGFETPIVTHAKLKMTSLGLSIQWLWINKMDILDTSIYKTEFLHFDQHPELRELHDGIGWNISEVKCLLGLVSDFDETTPATATP